MKVLFYSTNPFFLAHGGTQTLLESIMREVAATGVEVEPARWWDDKQKGDILHFMNRPTRTLVQGAQQKGFRTVMTETIDQTGSRGWAAIRARKLAFLADKMLGGPVAYRLSLEVYRMLDALVYCVELERQVAHYLYGAPLDRVHVIPHGVEDDAQVELAQPEAEGDYLVSAATIIPRKNTILLARAAKLAQVPVVFLGKPFNTDDPYYRDFMNLVDNRFVRYPGFVSREEKHRIFRGARGFALLSQFESGCIAVHEAAAAGLPLLLSRLPWATEVYGDVPKTRFAPLTSAEAVAGVLRSFYEQSHRLAGQTFPVLTWRQVGARYAEVYQQIMRGDTLPDVRHR